LPEEAPAFFLLNARICCFEAEKLLLLRRLTGIGAVVWHALVDLRRAAQSCLVDMEALGEIDTLLFSEAAVLAFNGPKPAKAVLLSGLRFMENDFRRSGTAPVIFEFGL
jgi:hypothetical protein